MIFLLWLSICFDNLLNRSSNCLILINSQFNNSAVRLNGWLVDSWDACTPIRCGNPSLAKKYFQSFMSFVKVCWTIVNIMAFNDALYRPHNRGIVLKNTIDPNIGSLLIILTSWLHNETSGVQEKQKPFTAALNWAGLHCSDKKIKRIRLRHVLLI